MVRPLVFCLWPSDAAVKPWLAYNCILSHNHRIIIKIINHSFRNLESQSTSSGPCARTHSCQARSLQVPLSQPAEQKVALEVPRNRPLLFRKMWVWVKFWNTKFFDSPHLAHLPQGPEQCSAAWLCPPHNLIIKGYGGIGCMWDRFSFGWMYPVIATECKTET